MVSSLQVDWNTLELDESEVCLIHGTPISIKFSGPPIHNVVPLVVNNKKTCIDCYLALRYGRRLTEYDLIVARVYADTLAGGIYAC